MNILDEDLDDSGLLCKSVVQKRKGLQFNNPKSSKQMKLALLEPSKGIIQENENQVIASIDDNTQLVPKEKFLSISSSCNTKWNESSCYFNKGKSISICPLCLKSFKSDSTYSAHMKQCAKSHKMTTQQLLEALELQKKQIQERRALGLCSQSLPSKKQSSKKKTASKIESCDLALGLALSESLFTTESKPGSLDLQKATLEEFGFTSKSVISKKKIEHEKKSILKERTTEERQRIIVEKVAVVLLDEDQGVNLNSIDLNQNSSYDPQPQLWNLGENNEKHDWYVMGIKTLVLSDDENTQEKDSTSIPDNIEKEISELNLPKKKFFESWEKMINNSSKSDLIGKSKDNQDFYLHSLVLFARCPELLETDLRSTLEKFNLSTILIFLEYLYCGTINSLNASELKDLFELVEDLNFKELSLIIDCLKSKLSKGSSNLYPTPPEMKNTDNEAEKTVIQKEKLKFLEDKDLFSEENPLNLTEEAECNETNVEKSYWSFIQHEKRKENSEKEKSDLAVGLEEITSQKQDTETLQRESPNDLLTRNLEENAKMSDCIVLSSGSEQQRSRTPSPVNMDYEIPYFDPYDNFHIFSEEQFSPVGLNSQSLLVGDISAESLKINSPLRKDVKESSDVVEEETRKTFGYCSTPVTVRQSLKIKSSSKTSLEKVRKKRMDLSANRMLRKSLNLQRKAKTPKSNSVKKNNKKKSHNEKEIVEILANSVIHELSKSSIFQRKNFVEITPLHNKDEFKESVTPSPNYSIMGESFLKEQLTKYGLKKNLAKSKAKKILRHIFEELHPLYNTETGKLVKMLPSNTPKTGKKSKTKKNVIENTKSKKNKKATEKITENDLNSSKDSDKTIGPSENDSIGSEFEDLNETLTQSMPSNAVDLPSAFCEFLQKNPEYHQKILLYEPIWLEELQQSLKETFKKHFKKSDIMDYLDQKCITFRSAAQLKKIQQRHKKKETFKKRSPSS